MKNQLKDIIDLIEYLNLKKADEIHIRQMSGAWTTNRIYPSPGVHSFYQVDLTQDRDHRNLINIEQSIQHIQGILILYKEQDSWMKMNFTDFSQSEVLEKLDRCYLYSPPQSHKMNISRFVELIAHLRSPQGCPWDRKQSHKTLRTNILEETYEVLEAIDEGDADHLQEELGDLLLQIVLHAGIASEAGSFDFGNVVHDIYIKIKNRHPHVFGKTKVNNVSDVMTNWEAIKTKERRTKPDIGNKSILHSIPSKLPALSVAQKYQERAARVGFDWEDISPVFEKVLEEIEEIKNAKDPEELEEELGDLLFAVVNFVRWSGFDAETVLRISNKKFLKRFNYIEKTVSDNGKSLTDATLSEMDVLWNQAKRNDH